MLLSRIFYVTSMSFEAIRENKILAKIYEFTVVFHFQDQNISRIRVNLIAELFQIKKRKLQLNKLS